MQTLVTARLDHLFDGVTEIVLADMPDHPNVGDSAIAMGEFAYFRSSRIMVKSASAIGTVPSSTTTSQSAVALHGGGNIGGLYGHHESHRKWLATHLRDDSLLIQLPQSISFLNSKAQQDFLATVGARRNMRIAVRDNHSFEALTDSTATVSLSPDAFHAYGQVDSESPKEKFVVLARTDAESATSGSEIKSLDWPEDKLLLRQSTRVRKHSGRIPGLSKVVNPSPRGWEKISELRFRRGVSLLSRGETVVTDRLHGMLIGLQMGRKVVAIDNANQKLTRYAETWFGRTAPDLVFAKSFSEALRLASGRTGN